MHQIVLWCCIWGWKWVWLKVWAGNQKGVGSNPARARLTMTLNLIGDRPCNDSFWIKASAKWLLTHAHKLLGCLISLQKCVFVVTVFLGKRWGVRADSSLKVWTALLLSSLHILFPVCHRLPSCHLYFSVRSVGLWRVSVSFLEVTVSPGRATVGPAPQACWDMESCTCLVSAANQLFCRSHSGICAFCQHVYKDVCV